MSAEYKVIQAATRKMTMLVIETQDKKTKGYEKNRKHRRAQELIEAGTEIQILSEKDFLDLIETT